MTAPAPDPAVVERMASADWHPDSWAGAPEYVREAHRNEARMALAALAPDHVVVPVEDWRLLLEVSGAADRHVSAFEAWMAAEIPAGDEVYREMDDSRDAVRAAVAKLNDADPDRLAALLPGEGL